MPARETTKGIIRISSLAVLIGMIPHYILFYLIGTPLWTERIAEWIMARTPSKYAVLILDGLGRWAKPWAVTGALAILGFSMFVSRWAGKRLPSAYQQRVAIVSIAAIALIVVGRLSGYSSLIGLSSFGFPAILALILLKPAASPILLNRNTAGNSLLPPRRREFLVRASQYGLPILMGTGTAAVALESYIREKVVAGKAAEPALLFPFQPALDTRRFGWGLPRKNVTPVSEFYGMSKNAIDPVIDLRTWRLTISLDDRPIRHFQYRELLSLPKQFRYQTLRCISNTLKSNLMGTAEWAGIHLAQIFDRRLLPPNVIEAAYIGTDGHDDSVGIDYAFGPDALLAFGMNGKTLSRTHGFPIRLLAPRYYGCRNVKWLSEIRFVTRPYYGTWQRLGYTKEPVVHIASHVDGMVRVDGRLRVAGVSFAGDRGISAVRVRANSGSWTEATLERSLSSYTWTRWCVELNAKPGDLLEANAKDTCGQWQELNAGAPFPTGPTGPTIVKVTV